MALYATKRRKLSHSTDSDSENNDSARNNDLTTSGNVDVSVDKEKRNIGTRIGGAASIKASQEGFGHFASSAYNSNTFKLQMDELLVKARPKYEKRMVKVENALRKLKGIIENIPSREALSISDAEKAMTKNHQLRIPFPEPRPDTEAKYTLAYAKPIDINVVGSYARRTAIQVDKKIMVDLAITMPSQIFQEKDFLNFRYFHKRAYYLACIAAGIQEANLASPSQIYAASKTKVSSAEACNFEISFAYQDDNPLQPIITIRAVRDGGDDDFTTSKCQIRIILAVKEDVFPILKTLPDKSCVRSKSNSASLTRIPDLPTPFYNATLRSECSSLPYLKLLDTASSWSDAFGEACVLGSIWLRQRGFGAALTKGGFGQFEWACVIALLMQSGGAKGRPILSTGYSSYQLFKAVLQFLSTRDVAQDPLFIQSDALALEDKTKPVLFDGTRGHNVLFKMTPWSYEMLRHEASITLKALSQTDSDGFLPTFVARIDNPFHRFDDVLKLAISAEWTSESKPLDCTDRHQLFCQEVHNSLRIGLGDRVNLIHPIRNPIPDWSTAAGREPAEDRSPSIVIGLLINSEQVSRTVDKGPSVEDKQAAAVFRKFWGEKAELRRFKDGSILESLIWNRSSAEDSILQQIIQYVIRRHLGSDVADSISFLGDNVEQLLPGPRQDKPNSTLGDQPLMTTLETLEKDLRSLEGLPLQVRQISAASPALRYTSLQMPILPRRGSDMEPADIHVQFEGSARWPDDISAVQITKIAFLLKIGELLEEKNPGLTSRLGLENEKHKFVNIAFVDIICPTGANFRLRIHHERELNLLERLLKDKSYDQGRREEIVHAASAYKRNFVKQPLHTQAVRTLSTRFPVLSPSVRLMKQWRDSHLLSSHISDELIELLTVYAFVHPYPWSAPGSSRTAFLRTLLFVSKWDWRSELLIVDFNGDLSSKEVDAISLRFEAWRKIDPAMNRIVMFAASNLDPDGVAWTEQGPSKVVAARFTSLAKGACDVVKAQGLDLEAQALFVPSYADYDFLVHLSPKFTGRGRARGKKQPAFKNLELQPTEDPTLVGFNPVQLFLDELFALFGSHIVFFHDAHQGSVIAGLWNPQTGPRAWKINVGYPTTPVAQKGKEEEAMIEINKEGVLHEIARLGGDLVVGVESVR